MKITITDLPSNIFGSDSKEIEFIEIEIPNDDFLGGKIESNYEYENGADYLNWFSGKINRKSELLSTELIFRFTMSRDNYSTTIKKKVTYEPQRQT